MRQAKPPQRQSFHRLWCLTVLLQGRHCYRISGNIHSIPYNVFLNRLYHVFPKHVQSHTPSKQFWNIGCLIVVVSSFGSLWPCMVVWIGAFLVQPPDGSVPLLERETHCNCCLFFLLIATVFFCSRKVNTWQLSKLAVHEHSPIKRNTTNSNDFSVVQLQYVPHYRLSTLQILVEIYTFIIYGWICFFYHFSLEMTKLQSFIIKHKASLWSYVASDCRCWTLLTRTCVDVTCASSEHCVAASTTQYSFCICYFHHLSSFIKYTESLFHGFAASLCQVHVAASCLRPQRI